MMMMMMMLRARLRVIMLIPHDHDEGADDDAAGLSRRAFGKDSDLASSSKS